MVMVLPFTVAPLPSKAIELPRSSMVGVSELFVLDARSSLSYSTEIVLVATGVFASVRVAVAELAPKVTAGTGDQAQDKHGHPNEHK
jgi:hypothetical protein